MKSKLFILITSSIFTLNAYSNETYKDEFSLNSMFQEYRVKSGSKQLERPKALQQIWAESKPFFLESAEYARADANKYFEESLAYAELFPDVDMKARLRNLINASINSLPISSPKEKVLMIALAVIGDAVSYCGVDAYNNYMSFRKKIALATASLEEANAFYSMALGAPLYVSDDVELEEEFADLSTYIEEAVQYLIIIDMHLTTMEYNLDGFAISSRVEKIRKKIVNEVKNHGGIIANHSDQVESLMENLYEITADFSQYDKQLVNEVYWLLRTAKCNLRIIEGLLGLNNDDD